MMWDSDAYEVCRMIHAGRLNNVQCASPIRRSQRSPKVLPSRFETDVAAERSHGFVTYDEERLTNQVNKGRLER